MTTIDWGDIQPAAELRARVEARIAELDPVRRPHVVLRRRGSGCEAQVRTVSSSRGAILRLHGDHLGEVVDRVVELLRIVERESARQRARLAAHG